MRYCTLKILTPLALLWSLALPQAAVYAQEEPPYWRKEADIGQPLFAVSTVHRISELPGKVRLDVYAEVVNDLLQFVREQNHYVALAELNLSVQHSDSGQIARQVKYLSQKVDKYERTNTRQEMMVGAFTVDLFPGDYTVSVVLVDRESQRRETVKKTVVLLQPSINTLNVSDVILTRSAQVDPTTHLPLEPLVSNVVPQKQPALFCYFDLYRPHPMALCRLSMSVYDQFAYEHFSDTLSVVSGEQLSSHFLFMETGELSSGRYKVVLTAESEGKVIERVIHFRVNSSGLPSNIQNLNSAVQQLRYIATKQEIQQLTEAFPSDKERLFIEFWNKNFPAPGQSVNGKMAEYYQRVNYCNEHFGNARPGWETDRGQVYMIYGAPTEIERQELSDQGIPYEIWNYSHLGKRFVFHDKFGFGDYELVTPIW